jgi:predicted DNA-binding protein
MPTIKTRINITVPKELERVIAGLAKRDTVPVATKARQMLETALEFEEDISLARLVKQREQEGVFVPFATVWKKYMR